MTTLTMDQVARLLVLIILRLQIWDYSQQCRFLKMNLLATWYFTDFMAGPTALCWNARSQPSKQYSGVKDQVRSNSKFHLLCSFCDHSTKNQPDTFNVTKISFELSKYVQQNKMLFQPHLLPALNWTFTNLAASFPHGQVPNIASTLTEALSVLHRIEKWFHLSCIHLYKP